MDKPTTRIDLERVGTTGIMVRKWFQGWQQDGSTPADSEEYIDGSIPALLAEYEKAGFVVWMAYGGVGRALRGSITRVDIIHDGQAWNMRKYCYGWSAKTPPIESKIVKDIECEAAVEWLKQNQWTLIQWEGGYRAFRGEAKPVRDRAGILALRRKFEEQHVNYRYDLAVYF